MNTLYKYLHITLLLIEAVLLSACQSSVTAPPLSNSDDILYAQKLWNVMQENNLVGEQAMPLEPFFGGAKPHGMILEIYSHQLVVANHKGFLVLKRNYNGDDVSVENVSKNREKYLSSITIMYQREAGYDEDNLNLFWAKYKPNGKLFIKALKNNKLSLAGRLIKGKNGSNNKACLYCHASAGGGDYIFYPDIKLPGFHYIEH